MKSITDWALILASVVIFTVVISIFFRYYLEVEENIRINKGVESFYILYNTLNKVCDSSINEKRIIHLYYPKEMIYIYGKNNNLCYKTIKIENCEKIFCEINFFNITIYNNPYIESLEQGFTKFEIVIEKIGPNLINVDYKLKI